MTEKRRVHSAASTHSSGNVKQGNSEYEVENHQKSMMLIDPEDISGGNTHSGAQPKMKGAKRPTYAALIDEQRTPGGKISQIPNDVDPAMGYLETETGMPVIDNVEASDDSEVEDDFEDMEVESEFEDLADTDEVDAEFEDEDDPEDVEAEFEDEDDMATLAGPEVEADEEEAEEEAEEQPLAFENDVDNSEGIAIVDADAMADDDSDDMAFATTANAVHAIKGNRIIASMGPSLARKAGMADLYMTEQFQDVVTASVEAKGIRKGLVQSGFVLAKVKLSAAKATAKMVEAKVAARVEAKVASMTRQSEALDQSMAIAAVGINRHFFKDSENALRASLESEFNRLGVRGSGTVIRAAFAEHGVAYARSIITLAQKLSAMPDEVRNQYASALDLTSDEDFEDGVDDEVDADFEDDGEEDYGDTPVSVTAALVTPARRDNTMLKAGVRNNAAMSILAGNASLV